LDSRFTVASGRLIEKLYGTPFKSDRRDDCYSILAQSFPLVVDHLYAGKYLSSRTLNEIDTIIENLRRGLGQIILAEPWMQQKTKNYAIKKLRKMKKIIGLVEDARDPTRLDARYNAITVAPTDTFAQMVVKAWTFRENESLRKLVNPALLTETEDMRSNEVNALNVWGSIMFAVGLFTGSFNIHLLLKDLSECPTA
jgi:predicted metalloendopeptidase